MRHLFSRSLAFVAASGAVILLVGLLSLSSLHAQAQTPSATRQISPATVVPGGTLTVTVTASFSSFAQVRENLPDGFEYVSGTPEGEVDGQRLIFTLLSGDRTISYTVRAAQSEGTYRFTGSLLDAYRQDVAIGGDSTVNIRRSPAATAEPTAAPTAEPTAAPTAEPTAAPTAEPTAAPTAEPTAAPTAKPTAAPTAKPTAAPTARPTATPTARPTATPTARPTATPTARATATPTARPTATPTARPTATPTARPTATPTPIPVIPPVTLDEGGPPGWLSVLFFLVLVGVVVAAGLTLGIRHRQGLPPFRSNAGDRGSNGQ